LNIIQDLKSYGFSNDKITNALENIFEQENSDFKHYFFEYFFCLHFSQGEKIVLVVQNDGSAVLVSELNMMKMLGTNMNENKPVLILPFYAYLAPISNILLNQTALLDVRSPTLSLLNSLVEEKYKFIIQALENDKYTEITIQKNDKNIIIRPKSKQNNVSIKEVERLIKERDFQNIELKVHENGRISLSREEVNKIVI